MKYSGKQLEINLFQLNIISVFSKYMDCIKPTSQQGTMNSKLKETNHSVSSVSKIMIRLSTIVLIFKYISIFYTINVHNKVPKPFNISKSPNSLLTWSQYVKHRIHLYLISYP